MRWAVAVAAALLFAGCGGEPRRADPGRAVFVAEGCGSCHTLVAAGARPAHPFGPDLDVALRHHDATSLRRQLLAPRTAGDLGGGMPSFKGRIAGRRLDALIAFLLAAPSRS